MSKEKTTVKEQAKSLLSKSTVAVIGKGKAARYEVAVRATVDCHKCMADKLSVSIVREEIYKYDAHYSLSKDVMQAIVNAIKGNKETRIKQLTEIAMAEQAKANKAKAKARGKTTSKGKGTKGKAKGKTGKADKHQDSILNLPDPSLYGDWQELLADYRKLTDWLAKAAKLLKANKMIR